MTQFALCKVVAPLRPLPNLFRDLAVEQPFVIEAARGIFGEDLQNITVPILPNGDDFASLFTPAHNLLHNGGVFRDTELANTLPGVLSNSEALALWWASDWHDLPIAKTIEELERSLGIQLRQDVGDVYIKWIKR
jgi:hypothetical protein